MQGNLVYHCYTSGSALWQSSASGACYELYKTSRKHKNHWQLKSFLEELDSEHRDVPYHTQVGRLSTGRVLNRCFELREEICPFMENKGKDTPELRDTKCLCEFAFLSDCELQGRGHIITGVYAAARAFKTKLSVEDSDAGSFSVVPNHDRANFSCRAAQWFAE